jgi:hypothetical protein
MKNWFRAIFIGLTIIAILGTVSVLLIMFPAVIGTSLIIFATAWLIYSIKQELDNE